MLFSATQTDGTDNLARMLFKNPLYISVADKTKDDSTATVRGLEQVCTGLSQRFDK